jgi:hypothetical protein
MPGEEARNLRPLGPKAVEAGTPQEAAADLLTAFPTDGVVDLVYVQEKDGAGGVELFWPSGEPLEYVRQDAPSVETNCSVNLPDICMDKFQPEGNAVAVDGGGWVCDSCASVVAPGV